MDELEFTAEVASWINETLAAPHGLPFLRAKCEMRGTGSRKRRDLTLLDKNQVVVLTGEVKLPYRKDGGSPYNTALFNDARSKALRAKTRFFFTWNVNQFVLWQTDPPDATLRDRDYRSWSVTDVHRGDQLELAPTTHAIKLWLADFLNEYARILRGELSLGTKRPDERFVELLESALRMPIRLNLEDLLSRYSNTRFKAELDRWMREDQGWTISDDPTDIQDNLDRAARFACYALVNKLVFHEALLKRHGERMERLTVPPHIDTGDNLRLHMEGCFDKAKEATADYETVFGEDHSSIGNRIPFYADGAVPHWRSLIQQIHDFDFSKLDYEIIGGIFELLISPDERRKYGQYYTRVEVVDLINSFCIRKGDTTVMDPACGGGTFLVRAYARKRELEPSRGHGRLLADLFGVDTSHFATHLTTINLATRDLIDEENYPQIARSDFFDIEANKAFLSLPNRMPVRGLGKTQRRSVEVPPLDAVVGNPPYIRQEDIPKSKKGRRTPKRGTKQYYQQLVNKESEADLSGRSDIHCYFWPHAASFLKEHGYLCFLTSSQWLDVEYGFKLQEWILREFEILAVLESSVEPWFVGARVATTVTILRRQKDERTRMSNMVRFVQLRRPLAEILAHDGTMVDAVSVADGFRDELLGLTANTVNERYRARLVRQGDLWREGVRLGVLLGRSSAPGADDPGKQDGDYYGGKWGTYVRAPDFWFEFLDAHGNRLCPLAEVADIWRGITSGKDCFFFPRDCSGECMDQFQDPDEFRSTYGVRRQEVASGRVRLVECGEGRGERRPIEARYLEPEVHSLMEVDGFTVGPEDCSRLILLVDKKKAELRGQYVLDYIEWGEKQGYHKGATCAARATKEREWYDLTGHERGVLFWPKAQQYRHAVPLNAQRLQCNCNLYDVHLPNDVKQEVAAGVLNCSFVVLSKLQYGRPVGVEGNLKTEVVDAKMMLVPDTRKGSKAAEKRVATAFERLKQRKALQFLSERRLREMAYREAGRQEELAKLSGECELDMPGRRQLDDAVLQLLGVGSKKERDALIERLYDYLGEFFESVRRKEEEAIRNKKRAKRRGHPTPADIAEQILRDIADNEPALLRQYERDFLDTGKPFDTKDLPAEAEAEEYVSSVLADDYDVRFFTGRGRNRRQVGFVRTASKVQNSLVALLAISGTRGFVRVPHEDEECGRVLKEYSAFVRQRDKRIRELVETRTSDEEMQDKILDALMPLVLQRR